MIHNSKLGYTKPLFILTIDHRTTFIEGLFGKVKKLSGDQIQTVKDLKRVAFEGFQKAVEQGVPPKDQAAFMVDENFGKELLAQSVKSGYITLLPVEKSGQEEFDFEYGKNFAQHIEALKPQFTKTLIRYNPEGDKELNERQRARLKILSDYCREHGYKFLIEALVPATISQLDLVGGDEGRYDKQVRPALTVKVISQLQTAGVEPDVWKIEGMEDSRDYEKVIAQARSAGRKQVSAVILGRGDNADHVEKWLRAGSQVEGIIGFAIGRTIFWQPLLALRKGKLPSSQAAAQIAKNYQHFYKIFTQAT